jgi:hypothetical protein
MKIFNNPTTERDPLISSTHFRQTRASQTVLLIDARHGIRPMRLGATSEIVYPCSHQSDKNFLSEPSPMMVAMLMSNKAFAVN